MEQRRKVLASVFACDPVLGSEEGTGWNLVMQLARFHEVWAITLPDGKANIERYMAEHPMPNLHWVYYDIPSALHRFGRRGERGERVHYNLWQIGAYRVARKLHKEIRFDVAHHLTWAQYWAPSYMALLDTQFVWGPIGGGESMPMSYYETLGRKGRIYEHVRDAARLTGHIHPFVYVGALRSRVALATTGATRQRLKALGARNIEIMQSAGLSRKDYDMLSAMPLREEGPFRLISIGRLLPWKGFHLGLQAFAQFNRAYPDSEYWIVGKGSDRERLEALAAELGVRDKVTFFGKIPRTEVLERIAACDVMVHPSLHDSSGWVTMEAMAAGRPVICVDLGGPGVQVTEETGFKASTASPEQSIREMAEAMGKLATDPELKRRMALAGRRRIEEHFLWDRVGERLAQMTPYLVPQTQPLPQSGD